MRDAAASDPPHSFHIEFLPTVYCASKAKHHPWWRALRAAGVPLTASWPDASFNATGEEPSADQWARPWRRCIDEASAADVTLMFAQEGERQMGALVEAGACLGAGKRLYLVSPHAWSFQHHPRVRCFASLEQAVAAVVAAA
jgi:hypothetical protein